MSATATGNERVKIGSMEFEAPPDKFLELLDALFQRKDNLNALAGQAQQAAASTSESATAAAQPVTISTV